MRIAVAGSGKLGASVLRPLLLSGKHQVVAVIQDGRQTRGFKRVWHLLRGMLFGGQNDMLRWAFRKRVPIYWIDTMDERELAPLRQRGIDVLLVSGFAIILKRPILDLPNVGCVNMHSSLLPKHRGPNPFSAVIAQGETETGVTFHVMEESIDTGAILDQTTLPIQETDTLYSIYHRACDIAAERVVEVMNGIEQHGLVGQKQDPSRASYDPKPEPKNAWINWSKSAVEIDRLVRGFAPNVLPRFKHGNTTVYIARTELTKDETDAQPGTVLSDGQLVKVATGNGVLRIRVAFVRQPFYFIWPSPLKRPVRGEVLGSK